MRAAIVTIAVLAACKAVPGRTHQPDTHRTAAATSPRWCWDSLEVRALGCSGGTAHRSGDTLYVRLAEGRERTFVEDRVSEAPGGFHYVGRIPRPPLQVIQSYGHESSPQWIFVSELTGWTAVASDEPLVSPDSARFVTAAQPDWNNCSERDHPSLDVWRFTDTIPVLEWRLEPWDCRLGGWGPTNPRWSGADTLEFVHNEQIDTNTSRVFRQREWREIAVHDRKGWRVIQK
jgi:hypothetical protein